MLRTGYHVPFASLLLLSLIACGGSGMNNATTGSNTATSSPTTPAGATPPASGSGSGTSSSQPGGSSSGGSSGNSGGNSGNTGGGSNAGTSQYVYIANSGSATVAGYKVNSDGSLAQVAGSPYLVPGQAPFDEEPFSIVAVGSFLYAASADPNTSNGIAGFKINTSDGTLTMFNPTKGDPGHYDFLVADSANGVVYAAGLGPNVMGISAFKVNADGSLTLIGGQTQPATAAPPGQTGFIGSLALDQQGRFLYDFHQDPSYQNKIYVFPRNSDGSLGAQVSGSPFAAGTNYPVTSEEDPNPCIFYNVNPMMVVDQSGRFLYSTCDRNGEINEFSVSNSGQLTPIGTVPATPQGELSSLAISHDGQTLFGTQEELNQVVSFTIDRSTGKLTPASTIAAGTRPNSIAVDVNNHFVYATNGSSNHSRNNSHIGSDNMSEYAVTSAGVMTPLPGSPITTGMNPRSVIVVSF